MRASSQQITIGIDFGKAPAGLGTRLQIAANDDPDCKTAGMRFDG